MSTFKKELAQSQPKGPKHRQWLFIPYDQLSDQMGPLSREDPRHLGIVLIECPRKADRRPYHKQKLALVIANLRHFALEQARRGVAVRHVISPDGYAPALDRLTQELGPIRMMDPAEWELRSELSALFKKRRIEVTPHEGWLTTTEQFEASSPKGPPYRMDAFYRVVRRETGLLMASGKPVGGKYSLDAQNRLPWKGAPPAPMPPTFSRDPIKEEVIQIIREQYAHHPGRLDLDRLPATREDAETLWSWARKECLPHFGPFEDAMSTRSRTLFHTRISALLNLQRLPPERILSDVTAMDLDLPSREGFIRQVLGWREFIRHVHRKTDGFRDLSGKRPADQDVPGDGGYSRWVGHPWKGSEERKGFGGACPNELGAKTPLPPAFWGEKSGLSCLDEVIQGVWEEGYGHHITRLMILCNLATLLDVDPRELTDWFWVAYTDAFDWVVEPNVLGMGTFALGEFMTTKPYVSGTPYILKMSDFCRDCAFDPKSTCPVSPLYWAFLNRHREHLAANPRLRMPLAALKKRGRTQKERDNEISLSVREWLLKGEVLTPEIEGRMGS